LNEAIRLFEQAGMQKGIGAALHELASIESAQGNPSEARRLLQRSLAIDESLGDQRGSAASLHQLAIIEMQAGIRDEARRLWEQSIRIKESIGDVAGSARTKSMLAQLEAMEGRFERAIELASQAVRELEQLGYAWAEQAHGVLRSIEQYVARGGSPGGPASSYLARLNATLTDWKSLSPAEQGERLARATETPADPAEAVLAWLAQSVVCWQQGDVPGCEAGLAQAQTLARASQDAELLALVASLFDQLAKARSGRSTTGSELGAAIKLLQEGNFSAAEPLLVQALAQARVANDPRRVATCQFYLGQVALVLERPAEAVTALREALELATLAGETELIQAVQQALTIATRAAGGG